MSNKRVCVVGLGYIGLPTAAMFAARGVRVHGVDVNQAVVETINRGEIHIVEPELDMIVHAAVTQGLLQASTQAAPAEAFLIAVPTPFKANHQPDLSYVQAAGEAIAPVLKQGDIVILESTSPVGTTEQLCRWLATARPDLAFPGSSSLPDVNVAYCPERVLPGHVVRELVENDRVIGGMTPICSKKAMEIYQIFVQGELLVTNAPTAEMCKLTENASRDVGIAFANELSMICDRLGVDVWELIRLANHHPRVNILSPGAGVGGHCIAVDPWFIVHKTPEQARLIHAAREINDSKPGFIIEKVAAAAASVPELPIVCLGLSFKPDIDDLRESPALQIAKQLSERFPGRVCAVEPHIQELPPDFWGELQLVNLEKLLQQQCIIVVLVGHRQFKQQREALSRQTYIIDAVGLFE